MSTPVEVRPVHPQEYDVVAELTSRTYLADGWADEHYAPVLRDVAARAAEATVLVALVAGRAVGAVTVATRGGRYAELAGPGEEVVRMLVTAPAQRGHGTGTALLQACLAAALADGCHRVLLSTQPGMAAAHRLYRRLGFVPVPELDWSPQPGLDLQVHALDLPVWCPLCGGRGGHPRCRAAAALEPPRYCARCRRRMVVQVTPGGWSARCAVHGTSTSP